MGSSLAVFTAYAIGSHYASACTSLTDAEAAGQLNLTNPQRGRTRWVIAREAFADGAPNGAPCDTEPATHRHLLFERRRGQ